MEACFTGKRACRISFKQNRLRLSREALIKAVDHRGRIPRHGSGEVFVGVIHKMVTAEAVAESVCFAA